MLRKFALFLCLLLPCICRAGIDNRYYVTDEMWKQDPYNKFVLLEDSRGWCTAQYVSHNLILSAGHCVSGTKGYTITNYKYQKIPVELIYNAYGDRDRANDWAVFRINKKRYFNNDFFSTSIPEHNVQVINAGYGYLRILTDNEIGKLKALMQEMNASMAYDEKIYNKLSEELSRQGMKNLEDDKLKASVCNLEGLSDSAVLKSNCYGWGGNSGGALVSKKDKILYGINVGGSYTFDNQSHDVVSSKQFQSTLKKLIAENGGVISNVDPDNNLTNTDDDVNEEVLGSDDIAESINALTTDISGTKSFLNANISEIPNMNNLSVLNFLDRTVELEIKTAKLQELQQKYEEAKAKEQSLANRTLTAATTAATGIGGMELAMGLSEQKADKDAEQDMMAYMETFRCEYGGGKSVKGGTTEIQLPADTLFDLYQEYITLAADVKTMKEQLDLAPGIESEVIIDKAAAGLYDDKASEKSNGTYASIYRAKMGNETDQSKLQEMAGTSGKRVKGGAIAAGAGALVGIVGNTLINEKLNDKIKEAKENINSEKTEDLALVELTKCLDKGGAKNTKQLKFSKFTPSILNLENIDCSGNEWKAKVKNKKASDLFVDSADAKVVSEKLVESFGEDIATELLGGTIGKAKNEVVPASPLEEKPAEELEKSSSLHCPEGTYDIGFEKCIDPNEQGKKHDKDPLGNITVTFDYGDIGVSSICSKAKGHEKKELHNGIQYFIATNTEVKPEERWAGRYCLCRMIDPVVSRRWVFQTDYKNGTSCVKFCATECAYAVQDSNYFRLAMFDSVDD